MNNPAKHLIKSALIGMLLGAVMFLTIVLSWSIIVYTIIHILRG